MKKAVFISSTFEDLQNHRRKIWDLLEKYDVNVRGMEKFGARSNSPLETCFLEIEQCKIFICVLAQRLGSIDGNSGKSYTQCEYEKAKELDLEILIYMIDEKKGQIQNEYIDYDNHEKLNQFKLILKENHTVDFFLAEDDLEAKLKIKFDELLQKKGSVSIESEDDYGRSQEIINKFLLVPKVYSGQLIKLVVDFVGEPFPASKCLCTIFNFTYGKTIGIKIKMKKPLIKEQPFEYVFITGDRIHEFFSLKEMEEIEIIGKVQFSGSKIDKLEANFIKQVHYYSQNILSSLPYWNSNPVLYNPLVYNPVAKCEITEAEGTIIFELIEIEKTN